MPPLAIMSRQPATPAQLFRLYEQGRIGRAELHAGINTLARNLLVEVDQCRFLGPRAAIDEALNRRAAAKLAALHGEEVLRESFAALAELENFPPAAFLWNARHRDVPFHCFLRTKRAPYFAVLNFQALPMVLTIETEYGPGKPQPMRRESFVFRRDRRGTLQLESRRTIQ